MFPLNLTTDELQFPHHPNLMSEAETILKECRKLGLKKHILLFSSGTTSNIPKGYGLSLAALIHNADAVNRHFKLTADDVWGLSLPDYHVGGLSVRIRAQRTKSKVVELGKWNPKEWRDQLENEGVTITTIVPTQLFDLIQEKLIAPSQLKYLVVGGDFLCEDLRQSALLLGWPVIKTFGMTEVGSQLASQKKSDGKLELLDIHQIKIDQNQRLWIKTPSLFSFEFKLTEKFNIKFSSEALDSDDFFPTQDLASFSEGHLHHLGRIDDQIKISGRLFSFNEIKEKIQNYAFQNNLFGKIDVVLKKDNRVGQKIVVLHLPGISLPEDLLSPLHFETHEVSHFEKSDLGKLKLHKL